MHIIITSCYILSVRFGTEIMHRSSSFKSLGGPLRCVWSGNKSMYKIQGVLLSECLLKRIYASDTQSKLQGL